MLRPAAAHYALAGYELEDGPHITLRLVHAGLATIVRMAVGTPQPGDAYGLNVIYLTGAGRPDELALDYTYVFTGEHHVLRLEGADPAEMFARTRLGPGGYAVHAKFTGEYSDPIVDAVLKPCWASLASLGVSRELRLCQPWRQGRFSEPEAMTWGLNLEIYKTSFDALSAAMTAISTARADASLSWSVLTGRHCAEMIQRNLEQDAGKLANAAD